MLLSGAGTDSRHLFLIEHSKGLNCCRLQPSGKNRVIPLGGQLPYAEVDLQLDEEAKILGFSISRYALCSDRKSRMYQRNWQIIGVRLP